jgi:hypothetical protein
MMDSKSGFAVQLRYNGRTSNYHQVELGTMETVRPVEKRGSTAALYHADQAVSFDYSERQAAFAARIMDCVTRAFDAIGASHATQEVVFWNLQVTRNLGRNEIIDKPSEFIEGLKAIYGEAGVVVFEYEMTKEIKREFGLTAAFDKEPAKPRNLLDLLHLVAYVALESQGNI